MMKKIPLGMAAALSVILPATFAFNNEPEPFRDYCNPFKHYRTKIGRITHGFSPGPETAEYDLKTSAQYYATLPEYLDSNGRLTMDAYREIERVRDEYLARLNDISQISDEKAGWGAAWPEADAYGDVERFPHQTITFNFPKRSTHQSITVANTGVLQNNPDKTTYFDQHIFLFPRVTQPSFSVIRCDGIPASVLGKLESFLLTTNEKLQAKYCSDPTLSTLYGDRYLTVVTLPTGEDFVVDAHTTLDTSTPFEEPEFQVLGGAMAQIPRQDLYPRRPKQARVFLYPKFLLDYRGRGMQIEFAESDFYTGIKGIKAFANASAPVRVTCGEMCECTKPGGCKTDAQARLTCKLPFSKLFSRFSSGSECVKLTAGSAQSEEDAYVPADDETVSAAVEKACGFRLTPQD